MSPTIRKKLLQLELLDACRVAAGKPLSEHLEDWQCSLDAKGNTPKHVNLMTNRVRGVVANCGFKFWSDISATKVENYLHNRRQSEERFGAQSCNFYLQAIKQFCRWMVSEGRASESPLAQLKGLNVRTDRRHDRRALSVEEMGRFLESTHNGPVRKGRTWSMTGPDRAVLYRLAMETGFRSSELRSLTTHSFDLGSELPTATVKASYSKRGREDSLPLRPETAESLRGFLYSLEDGEHVFNMPRNELVVRLILRPDLELARQEWLAERKDTDERAKRERSDFLKYVDRHGHFADFHALRHSYITNICRVAGLSKTAQDLARHSTPVLTARYAHSFREEEIAAVNGLPDLPPLRLESRRERPRKAAKSAPKNSASYSSSKGAEQCNSVQLSADSASSTRASNKQRNTRKGEILDEEDDTYGGSNVEAAAGFEPANDGFANRCLRPLGYAASDSAAE